MLIYFKLSEKGYGSVNEIEKWDARKVIQAIHYINFLSEYEDAYMEMNKNDNS